MTVIVVTYPASGSPLCCGAPSSAGDAERGAQEVRAWSSPRSTSRRAPATWRYVATAIVATLVLCTACSRGDDDVATGTSSTTTEGTGDTQAPGDEAGPGDFGTLKDVCGPAEGGGENGDSAAGRDGRLHQGGHHLRPRLRRAAGPEPGAVRRLQRLRGLVQRGRRHQRPPDRAHRARRQAHRVQAADHRVVRRGLRPRRRRRRVRRHRPAGAPRAASCRRSRPTSSRRRPVVRTCRCSRCRTPSTP